MKIRTWLLSQCILTISANGQQVIPLYTGPIPNGKNEWVQEAPILTAFLPAQGKRNGTAVVLIPGGAYSMVAYKEEAVPTAPLLVKEGVCVFVLQYRLPAAETMTDPTTGPLQDAEQAMKVVRMRAREWGVDAGKIGVMGFSAGGHLAAMLATHYDSVLINNPEKTNLRPDFMVLLYPVISMKDELTHQQSRHMLLGDHYTAAQVKWFSAEEQVNVHTPPTYLTHAGDDNLVTVGNSIVFYLALIRQGVAAEMLLYPRGNHGFVLHQPADEWLPPLIKWMKAGGWLAPKVH